LIDTTLMKRTRSEQWFAQAQHLIPGGVNSPVRAFRAVGGTPVFFERGEGPHLIDVDGNRYIDYVGSWGPMILGHADPDIVRAVSERAAAGMSFGAPTALEVELAATLTRIMPSIESVRLTSSGTEATMSAIRVARGFTGRKVIVKFEGCYHGHGDMLLVKAGSGALTFGHPSSAGVPPEVVRDTLTLDFNCIEPLESLFRERGNEIAAVIIEPVAGNMNFIAPSQAYHSRLRELCTQHGALLIFDEVMTGFRVGLGGAQAHYGITPDLTTLGKVIGGGMPMGAFGGRRDVMNVLAPLGPVYQAGTLSGNPVAVTAGLATLAKVAAPGFFDRLSATTQALCEGLEATGKAAGVPIRAASLGGMFGFYFSESLPSTYAQVMQSDRERFNRFFHAMLDQGVYFAPSAYEAGFVSIQHTQVEVAQTLASAAAALAR
jgi:glutamate-1-semialdehyde 2,1-aminomutase